MGLVETEGLILKSYSLAEADKIVVFLTQHQGLIRGVAKGAKRLKSKFGGALEPFSIVHLEYFQKEERELVSISQIELVKSYFEKASEPEFLQSFAYLSELLLEFAPPHDPNERLYRMAKVCLETAVEFPESLESIALYFELWILRLGGYLPNWSKCDDCRRELTANEETSLQINFHLLCKNCQKSRSNWKISPAERQIFSFAQQLSPTKFVEFALQKKEEVIEVSATLKKIISHILGKEINSEKVLIANP
ncbi:MAG TPA: DNA repair protein RecO [Pyrinomonadaceae bacterium]|jgi:DNA repair protein RecO (recombination protein O)